MLATQCFFDLDVILLQQKLTRVDAILLPACVFLHVELLEAPMDIRHINNEKSFLKLYFVYFQ